MSKSITFLCLQICGILSSHTRHQGLKPKTASNTTCIKLLVLSGCDGDVDLPLAAYTGADGFPFADPCSPRLSHPSFLPAAAALGRSPPAQAAHLHMGTITNLLIINIWQLVNCQRSKYVVLFQCVSALLFPKANKSSFGSNKTDT